VIVGSLIYCARLVACVLSSPADVDIGDPDMSLQTCLTRTREHCYYREPTNYYWSSPYVRVHGRTAPTATPGAARGYRRCSTEDSSFLACRPAVWFAQVEAQFFNQGVAQQQTRFDYVIAALAPEVPTEVRDLILQLLRHMQQPLGDSGSVPDSAFVRQLSLQCLLPLISMVLPSSSTTLSLPQLTEMADRILEVATPLWSRL